MKVFIVIPAYNEEKIIGKVIADLFVHYKNIVVIDDGSRDNTGQAAQSEGAIVLKHVINRGQGAALKTGIEYVLSKGADLIVTFDADGQHEPSDIINLINILSEKKVDVVLGSRFLNKNYANNIPKLRRFILKVAVLFTRAVSNIKVTDTHNGLRVLTREAAQKINIKQDRMAHASEIFDEISRHKLKFLEAPVNIKYSQYSMNKGQSSLSFGRILIKYFIGRILR